MSPDQSSTDIGIGLGGSPEPPAEYQQDSDNSSSSKEKYNNNNSYVYNRTESGSEVTKSITSPLLLSKWLESAARFQPSETNYSWWGDGMRKRADTKVPRISVNSSRHDRDEVEAAVALTALATATSRVTAP